METEEPVRRQLRDRRNVKRVQYCFDESSESEDEIFISKRCSSKKTTGGGVKGQSAGKKTKKKRKKSSESDEDWSKNKVTSASEESDAELSESGKSEDTWKKVGGKKKAGKQAKTIVNINVLNSCQNSNNSNSSCQNQNSNCQILSNNATNYPNTDSQNINSNSIQINVINNNMYQVSFENSLRNFLSGNNTTQASTTNTNTNTNSKPKQFTNSFTNFEAYCESVGLNIKKSTTQQDTLKKNPTLNVTAGKVSNNKNFKIFQITNAKLPIKNIVAPPPPPAVPESEESSSDDNFEIDETPSEIDPSLVGTLKLVALVKLIEPPPKLWLRDALPLDVLKDLEFKEPENKINVKSFPKPADLKKYVEPLYSRTYEEVISLTSSSESEDDLVGTNREPSPPSSSVPPVVLDELTGELLNTETNEVINGNEEDEEDSLSLLRNTLMASQEADKQTELASKKDKNNSVARVELSDSGDSLKTKKRKRRSRNNNRLISESSNSSDSESTDNREDDSDYVVGGKSLRSRKKHQTTKLKNFDVLREARKKKTGKHNKRENKKSNDNSELESKEHDASNSSGEEKKTEKKKKKVKQIYESDDEKSNSSSDVPLAQKISR